MLALDKVGLEGNAFLVATVVAVVSAIVVVRNYLNSTQQRLKLPHPKGWPLVGNALHMNQCGRTDQTLEMWAKQHGPVFTVQVFNMTWVILSGYNEIHEALIQKSRAFAGRHRFFRFSWFTFGNKDIVMADPTTPHFQPMRKALHRALHFRGDNLNRIETILVEMARQFVNKVKSYDGKSVDLKEDIYNFVCKISVAMIVGRNVEDSDDMLHEMKEFDTLSRATVSPIEGVELDLFPWLRHFGHPTWKTMQVVCKLRDNLCDKFWQLGTASYTSGGDANPACIVHALAQLFDNQSQFYEPSMTYQNIRAVFYNIIGASVLTTSGSAYALVNLLLHHPRVYKRLQEETDTVVGHDRPPNIFDRESMPYTTATILELIRYHSIAPTLLPHMTLEDTSVGGYFIPANTIVMPLVCYLHHDEQFWGDPLVFRPERFLDEAGKLLPSEHPNRKHVMQFGGGMRECVGEVFALRRLFIFTASLVQAFDLEPGDVIVSCEQADYEQGAAVTQKPYPVRLIPRLVN